MIIWFTGQPGSGKTTLADLLHEHIDHVEPFLEKVRRLEQKDPVRIDGDDIRKLLGNPGYTEKGRRQNIDRAMAIARFMEHSGFTPIVSLISPYRDQREELKRQTQVLEIHTFTTERRGRELYFVPDYERPLQNYTFIDTTDDTPEGSLAKILPIYREMAAISRGA